MYAACQTHGEEKGGILHMNMDVHVNVNGGVDVVTGKEQALSITTASPAGRAEAVPKPDPEPDPVPDRGAGLQPDVTITSWSVVDMCGARSWG